MMDNFVKKSKEFGLTLDSDALSKFEKLYFRLVSENEKYNLTAITDRESVYLLHFLDSLSAASYIPDSCKLCDIGSGAGFPGIPLKIVKPDIVLTLVDSVNKKVNYLNGTLSLLQLHKSTAIHTRVEDFAKTKERESFDVVVSRAVAKLNTLCEYCLPLLKVGGKFIAYKSSVAEELQEAKNAINILGGKLKEVVSVDISDTHVRNIVIIEKVSKTPKNFPRDKNKPKISPIL